MFSGQAHMLTPMASVSLTQLAPPPQSLCCVQLRTQFHGAVVLLSISRTTGLAPFVHVTAPGGKLGGKSVGQTFSTGYFGPVRRPPAWGVRGAGEGTRAAHHMNAPL